MQIVSIGRQILFPRKNKTTISKSHLLKILPRVLTVKITKITCGAVPLREQR